MRMNEDGRNDEAMTFRPIGVARTPFTERVEAPRQAPLARDVEGVIELFAGQNYEDALYGLSSFTHIWVVFAFHLNRGTFHPKVLPPRSQGEKLGVFATRSPHRPNPIGLSAVQLVSVEGRHVRVRGIDILDGTPVLDLKPYVAYADAIPDAGEGWLAERVAKTWTVRWEPLADAQARWLEEHGVAVRAEIEARLALGPQAHAYRRIKVENGRSRLAWKDWRAFFRVELGADSDPDSDSGAGRQSIVVESLATGYRPSQLADPQRAPAIHRDFAVRWP